MADSIINGTTCSGDHVSVLTSQIVLMRHIQADGVWPERTCIETRNGNAFALVEDLASFHDTLAKWKKSVA